MLSREVIKAVLVGFTSSAIWQDCRVALSTPFFMGYPKAAISSGIIEDDYHNKVDKEKFTKTDCYSTIGCTSPRGEVLFLLILNNVF